MSRSRPLIHPGATEHYVFAENYEARYAARTEDVDYYVKQVRSGQRVLEYGSGAGRLTLKLAEKGAVVCAVDASSAMIQLLRRRIKMLSPDARRRIEVHKADMRTFSTQQRFDWIISAFHTVGHLYSTSDVASFLQLAFQQLKPGGKIAFDLPLPRIDMPEYDPIAGVRVTEMDGPNGPELLTQRWYQPQEIAMHLHYAGFRRIRLTADFSSAPIDGETSVFVVTGSRPLA